MCVFIVCLWSQSKKVYCLGVYSVLQRQTVSEADPGAMLHHKCITLPTQVASYPKLGLKWEHTILLQCTCTFYTFPQFGRGSRSLGRWKKKVPHVWTKIGLYIPMWLPECYRFPKHWTCFSEMSPSELLLPHRHPSLFWHTRIVR